MVLACPRCYSEKMTTVPLQQKGEEWHCTKNGKHRFKMDAHGFPRMIK